MRFLSIQCKKADSIINEWVLIYLEDMPIEIK